MVSRLLNRRQDGTSEETGCKPGLYRRMRLRRADGQIYLDRWGLRVPWLGLVYLHRMQAPDPGVDLHDHPFWFASLVLWGGYVEERASVREAPGLAAEAERRTGFRLPSGRWFPNRRRGAVVEARRPGTLRTMRLDECHTITHLFRRTSWSLVIGGPYVRRWGFYTADGWVDERTYDETVRAERRDLWNEVGT